MQMPIISKPLATIPHPLARAEAQLIRFNPTSIVWLLLSDRLLYLITLTCRKIEKKFQLSMLK
jgi:hypothetical protein